MESDRNDVESLKNLLKGSDIPSCVGNGQSKDLATRAWAIHRSRSVRMSRMMTAIALVGCYIAGLLSTRLIPSETHDTVGARRVTAAKKMSAGAVSKAASQEKANRSAETVNSAAKESFSPLTDEATSNLAITDETAYSRYRTLGNTYLQQRNGIEAAVECYTAALDQATDDELGVLDEHDSWLLIALKRERREDA